MKAKASRRHNRKLKITRELENNKLTPVWEGPFRFLEDIGRGAYRLEQLDSKKLPRTWNAASLRMAQRPIEGRLYKVGPVHSKPDETWIMLTATGESSRGGSARIEGTQIGVATSACWYTENRGWIRHCLWNRETGPLAPKYLQARRNQSQRSFGGMRVESDKVELSLRRPSLRLDFPLGIHRSLWHEDRAFHWVLNFCCLRAKSGLSTRRPPKSRARGLGFSFGIQPSLLKGEVGTIQWASHLGATC
ncbi:hypothetical protein CR513_39848, partial [Mucuna pruriens]